MTVQKQVDDHVQSSAMGAVKPQALHPGSGLLVPVSAATPDAEPKAERIQPPQHTGHDIGPNLNVNPIEEGPYAKLERKAPTPEDHSAIVEKNAELSQEKLESRVANPDDPLQAAPALSDPPFPRVIPGLPHQGTTGPVNAATNEKHSGPA